MAAYRRRDNQQSQGIGFFQERKILDKLRLLDRVGLGYLQLGQSLSTLSGGEAQRLKLADELSQQGNLYVLDEPTTGLHISDIRRLMSIIHDLIDNGNSVVVIEHNLEVIAHADWIIDMGPGGGQAGGRIVAQGVPWEVCRNPSSITGLYLKPYLTA